MNVNIRNDIDCFRGESVLRIALSDLLPYVQEKEEWGVGMTHGINYGYDAFKEPSLFWEHLDKVKRTDMKSPIIAGHIRMRSV